ncbi:MAG: hypothetical protein EON60_06490 [Alphaproteobacteria bacterium]|nr:MAG: hypothetical protein EON60_06490 [Alphaproteobacteria bacterium]
MAPKPPVTPQVSPRATGGFVHRQVIGTRVRPLRSGTSPFPLLPMLAAAFLLLGAAQLGFWWWETRLPGQTATQPATQIQRFAGIARLHDAKAVATGQVPQAQRLTVGTRPENLQFGDAMASVVVTVFTDPACGTCRTQVRAWTANLPAQGVKIVYKFWPMDPERTTPGMLLELARRENVVSPVWRSLQDAGTADLDDGALLTMLDRAGVSLDRQRKALVEEGPSLMAILEPDLKTARDAALPPPPVVLVDDYLMDGAVLQPSRLNTYVHKRLNGQTLFERDDLWLMKK